MSPKVENDLTAHSNIEMTKYRLTVKFIGSGNNLLLRRNFSKFFGNFAKLCI